MAIQKGERFANEDIIPGHRLFDETNLRMLGDLNGAYANFYIELIGGRDWSSYKLI
ncbi:hypothetical protein [Pseudomonas sp. IT-P4]